MRKYANLCPAGTTIDFTLLVKEIEVLYLKVGVILCNLLRPSSPSRYSKLYHASKSELGISTPVMTSRSCAAACWDCAKNGHTCRPVPAGAISAVRAFWELNRPIDDVNKDPDDAWHSAA
ncbi:hypothetical protein B0J13DRAFT_557059 [Dactylonectria estremocensis]|uniref:Uncharacterized protein n=1 Tax=Dactylonectria estremocensis TaxID=1079267 RepID=A0A9P9EQ76_9HYPO|nr:hypothetical protein B0J13DRAFT_557059 [Dactylonectria estremocensis]